MSEEWRDIIGYEGLYQVSSYGNTRSLERLETTKDGRKRIRPAQTISQYLHYKGYKRVTLCKDGIRKAYLVHRLVAEAFIPNPDNKPQINHIDEDKTNNAITNLEWVTNDENLRAYWRTRSNA